MLEQNAAFNPTAPNDAGFKAWQGSMTRAAMRYDVSERTAGPMPVFSKMVWSASETSATPSPATSSTPMGVAIDEPIATATKDSAQNDEYSFNDVLDIINPLQHLPVIGTLYRKFTGDTIKPMSDIIGGAIFGGPIGAVASTVNVCVKGTTGKDITENAFAMAGLDVTPDGDKPVIQYDIPKDEIKLASATISDANAAYIAADGRKNFAAQRASGQIWNV
ncbi:MAG: hypothetical protein DI551_05445 [Micavibrio aeruginosavorus]|uniref:Uncharacterized protein n=1 Tax=Micavibrio aeruginosavorus TaxID=349221 RepID=A0A2W5N1G8_9BACT|nr:MAG: hypothetical protein DI551_05445 [Micavibrio aeruginosavorus]